MYICLCEGVTDSTIAAVASVGAKTIEEVGRVTGAGTVCGGCRPAIEHLLSELRSDERTNERSA